jgi:sigma-B regulation protein RsbU (phosphoserine phosphatase)
MGIPNSLTAVVRDAERIRGLLVAGMPSAAEVLDPDAPYLLRLIGDALWGSSERVAQARRAADQERLLAQTTEAIGEGFCLVSPSFDRVYSANSAFESLLNVSSRDLNAEPALWRRAVHPADKDRLSQSLEEASGTGFALREEFRVVDEDGSARWVSFRTFPVSGRNYKVEYIVGLAADISARKAEEIERVRALDREIQIAARIQRALLVGKPFLELGKLSLSAVTIPSQRIDGDFYNLTAVDEDHVDIFIGDVMGKGIGAALIGAAARIHFLEAASRLLRENQDAKRLPRLRPIVEEAHATIISDLLSVESYLTLSYARFDTAAGRLSYVDCGNTPILHYRKSEGSAWFLKGDNLPLGFVKNESYVERAVPLDSGDVLLFFSDGISEAEGSDGEPFGIDRIVYYLEAHADQSPSETTAELTTLLRYFVGGNGFRDDVTLAVVGIGGSAAETDRTSRETMIGSSASEAENLRDWLYSLLPPEKEETDALVLACHEAFTNVCAHGQVTDGQIRASLQRDAHGTYVSLFYRGEPFDWTAPRSADILELSESGYGMSIMEAACDSVVFRSNLRGECEVLLSVFSDLRGE